MRIVLINPPDENVLIGNNPKVLEESRGYNPPLGLLYLGAVIKRDTEHDISIIDCQVERLNQQQLSARIKSLNPDVVGVSCMTFTLIDAIKTVQTVRTAASGAITVLGGPHVHLYPEETSRLEGVDFIITGEGEFAFRDLVEALDKGLPAEKIPGVAFIRGEEFIFNPPENPVDNLDDLPLPDRTMTPWKKYDSVLGVRSPVTTMFTSRGCPYKCLFCDRPHLGKAFRARSAASVIKEFEECERLGIGEILVYDDTFTIDRQRVIDICNGLIEKKINISWDIRARVNTVDPEMLDLLRKAGCQRIHYGVEAGTEDILKTLRKGITLQQVRDAFRETKKAGISTLAYFMIGSPGETEAHIEATLRFAREIDPDFVHITITTPFPGTPLYFMALENGVIERDVWREFSMNPDASFIPPYWNETLSTEQLHGYIKRAYREFYFRPSYMIRRLIKVRSVHEFTKKFKAALRLFLSKD